MSDPLPPHGAHLSHIGRRVPLPLSQLLPRRLLMWETQGMLVWSLGGEDASFIPGWGRSTGGWKGNPLQYSCLGNSMDRGAWRVIVHGAAKSPTPLSKHKGSHTETKVSFFSYYTVNCTIWNIQLDTFLYMFNTHPDQDKCPAPETHLVPSPHKNEQYSNLYHQRSLWSVAKL